MSAAPQSTPAPQPRHAGTAPSTPLPEYTASSSPLFSAQSYPHTSLRSHADMRAPARSKAPQRVPMIPFDEHAMPTPEQLEHAASLVVVAQSGLRVPFGDLFRIRRTIVIFIRHFWCPLCQDYMSSVTRAVDPEELKRAGVDLVFIGNGSPGMIKSYRQIFHTPFAIYTDPTLRLHAALGMTRRTTDPGPESEKGAYTQHGLISGIAMVVRNALRVGMPVWEKGGDVAQLGGEFVLGPGLDCTFAHRMRTTRSHEPIMTVLAAAGVRSLTFGGDDAARSVLYPEDEDAWMAHRRRSLARLHARREGRRRGTGKRSLEAWCGDECELPYGSDVDGGSVSGCWGSSAREPSEDAAERRARRLHAAGPNANANAHPYTDMGRQGAPRLPPEAHEMYGAHVWEGGVPDLTLMENYGQTDGEPYRLTREVLAYSFGKA
ncbi:AhpC/TSA antioxidant enzyme-domain-containing protein [Amylocystis lapponica]|nr:AhpC/TSA antioxidant enzyme-domain-containing protein [Amylocystis lapponica]